MHERINQQKDVFGTIGVANNTDSQVVFGTIGVANNTVSRDVQYANTSIPGRMQSIPILPSHFLEFWMHANFSARLVRAMC
mmetsp:Transcript_9136/g.17228  ORF Transcript_9136/g.17228 Transcript_9136/m.17228 type:complete len:81 (+) Transcript_9136:1771-2013(+)